MKNCTGIFCPMQCGTVDPATCQAADSCFWATPPKTNADRIRSMTDEELAEFISDKARTFGEEYEGYMSALDWLKQNVEEGV